MALKSTAGTKDGTFKVSIVHNFLVDRKREVVRGDTLRACEGAIIYFKRIAADAAGRRTAGSELARKFEKHDSGKDVPADTGWVAVGEVTGFSDTVLQPDSVFELR